MGLLFPLALRNRLSSSTALADQTHSPGQRSAGNVMAKAKPWPMKKFRPTECKALSTVFTLPIVSRRPIQPSVITLSRRSFRANSALSGSVFSRCAKASAGHWFAANPSGANRSTRATKFSGHSSPQKVRPPVFRRPPASNKGLQPLGNSLPPNYINTAPSQKWADPVPKR